MCILKMDEDCQIYLCKLTFAYETFPLFSQIFIYCLLHFPKLIFSSSKVLTPAVQKYLLILTNITIISGENVGTALVCKYC